MRTDASWKEQQRMLAAARVLAEFANLEPTEVARFRTKHPDFAPPKWWNILIRFEDSPETNQWQKTQETLRHQWGSDFGSSTIMYMALFASVFDPDEMGLKQQQRQTIFATPFQITETKFHLAIKWLAGNNWRAKTCDWCGKRFIREHSQGKFCNFGVTVGDKETTCVWAYRKGYKKENWNKNSDEVNEQRRRKYRLEHPNRKKRRSHAKRKNLRQG